MHAHRLLPRLAAAAPLFMTLTVLAFAGAARADDPPAPKPADPPADTPEGAKGAAAPAPGGIPADTEIVTTASGLRYSVLVPGKPGKHPKRGARVKVHYTGWLTDGTRFESSRDRGAPADFTVGPLVEGWNEALCLMTAGARWKLTIPANLGYGAQGSPPKIPPNATLVFDLELIDFQSLPDFHEAVAAAQKTTESGLKWEVVTPGTDEVPGPEDALELRFALWTPKGDLLDCSERTGGSIKVRRADLPLEFMREGAALLHTGERIRFEVPPALCFKDQAMGPLPANSVTVWEMELVRALKPLPVPPFEMPADERLTTTKSGLKYEVVREGEGTSPHLGGHVLVHYAGWLADGTLFDSSYGRGEEAEMQLGRVIPGWTEGLQLMKPGAVYRFVIPPQLAYGPRGAGDKIKPNSTLVFLITLVKVL